MTNLLHTAPEPAGDARLRALAEADGLSPEAAAAVARIDRVMQGMRRSMMRREFGRAIMAEIAPELDVAQMDTLAAIIHTNRGGEAEVTVGLIAERLNIDPSRASRLVADVVDRGYARRVASQADARRICLELTAKGRSFIDAFQEAKWHVLNTALGQWQESELVEFARLLERFSTWTTDGRMSGKAER